MSDSNKRNVIFTIFAGRKCFLEVLFKYLDFLIDCDKLHEIHVWNYTRSSTDNIWLKSLKKNKYIVYEPKNRDGSKTLFQEYYDYYANKTKYNDNDIIIKCDDDVVFIDTEYFDYFIDQIDDEHFYFPNIVNNDVCAHIQSKNEVHQLLTEVKLTERMAPLSKWYMSYDKAKSIHDDFLTDQKKYVISGPNIIWKSRISINFFAGQFRYIKKRFTSFVNRKRSMRHIGDEPFFANFDCVIVPKFVVSHFSFGPQASSYLANELLIDYYMLADRQLKKKTEQMKRAIYGVWCNRRNELWIKKRLTGPGLYNDYVTVLHSYDDEIVEIRGLDFPNEDMCSMKCLNLSEARCKFKQFLKTHDEYKNRPPITT